MPPETTSDDLRLYLAELREHLEIMAAAAVRLESGGSAAESIEEIFRSAHTVKGSSGMMGYKRMAALTHEAEDVLEHLRGTRNNVTPELIDALLACIDAMRTIGDGITADGEPDVAIESVIAALAKHAEQAPGTPVVTVSGESGLAVEQVAAEVTEPAAEAGLRTLCVLVQIETESGISGVRALQVLKELAVAGRVLAASPDENALQADVAVPRLEAIVSTDSSAKALQATLSALGEVEDVNVEELSHGLDAAAPDVVAPLERKTEAVKSVRIDIARLDELMNLVGELVIDRNRLSSLSADLREVEGHDELTQSLLATSGRIVKTVDGLNRTVMQVRMLPVGTLFASFPRLVRDLGRSLGKQATLTIEGESTELDRSVLEKIRDPLVHLIRNAMDHGIEDPEGRRAAGKPETGALHLSARQAQGYVVIELADDGGGLDLELVREAAVSKGIVSREGTQLLTDDAVADLIFHPGLSTAVTTTDLSGRGVGMDAVRREIEALGGSVELASERGRKTTVTLRLPLTLASLPGLTVEAGGAAYAIPSSYVRETARVAPEDVTTVLGRRLINLRGSALPLLDLGAFRDGGWQEVGASLPTYAVVVDAGERVVALGVDALTGQQEVIVKPLTRQLSQGRGVSGASILGDGRVLLVLDVGSLLKNTPVAPTPAPKGVAV